MEILDIHLHRDFDRYSEILSECKTIISENLASVGGTLKRGDIFELDFDWEHLIIARQSGCVAGFALIRQAVNEHGLDYAKPYHYLSDIVVSESFRGQGIGGQLLSKAIEICDDAPLVASVLRTNAPSIKLLSKYMTRYGSSADGKYLRYIKA